MNELTYFIIIIAIIINIIIITISIIKHSWLLSRRGQQGQYSHVPGGNRQGMSHCS